MGYQEYLQSKPWQLTKARLYGTSRFTGCFICRSFKNLNVHHKTYKNLGKENLYDLKILCETCHHNLHNFHKKYNNHLNLWTITTLYKNCYSHYLNPIFMGKRFNSYYKKAYRIFLEVKNGKSN